MLSFSLGNNRRSILKPRFSKGVVMSSGIAGTDMSLDELTAHINNRVNNGIDPGTNSRSHESPLAELDRVWKANANKSGTKVRRNATADVKSMPADGLQTSEQYFSPRGIITHSGAEMPAEILSRYSTTTTTDDADDNNNDDAATALPHRSPSPPGGTLDVDSDSRVPQFYRSRLVTDAIAAYNDKAGSDCDPVVPLTDSDSDPARRRSSRVRLTGTTTAVAKLAMRSRKLMSHREHEIAAREMASPTSSITEGGMIGLIASEGNLSPRMMRRVAITIDDDTDARDLHRNLPPPQLEKNKSFYHYAPSTEESSDASKPGLLYELIAQRKASTKSTPGSLTVMESRASSAASLELSSPTRRRTTVIDAKTNLVPSPPTYKRSSSFTSSSLNGGACSPTASPRPLSTGLKMTLVNKPDGPNIPLGNNDDAENAAAVISSPRTSRALSQRERPKRSVSFSLAPDACLEPVTESYSSPRPGRNDDNKPGIHRRKPVLSPDWLQPQDILAKAKVPDLVVKLPDLDLSKKASVMGISSTNAANCAGPQRNFSLPRRTCSN